MNSIVTKVQKTVSQKSKNNIVGDNDDMANFVWFGCGLGMVWQAAVAMASSSAALSSPGSRHNRKVYRLKGTVSRDFDV